ncbi:ATP-binding cassette sub-family A member 10-like [Gastrophryne carolinensis]
MGTRLFYTPSAQERVQMTTGGSVGSMLTSIQVTKMKSIEEAWANTPDTWKFVIPMCLSYTSLTYLLSCYVAAERKEMREIMRTMGMMDSAFWLSWGLLYAVYVLLIANLLSLLVTTFMFIESSYNTILLLFTLYGLASHGANLMGKIGKICVESNVGKCIVTTELQMEQLLAGDHKALHLEKEAQGVFFLGMVDESFQILCSYISLTLDTILYMILTLYLDKVLPDQHGMKHEPLFFARSSFWRRRKTIPPLSMSARQKEPDSGAHIEKFPSSLDGKEAIRINNVKKNYKGEEEIVEALKGLNFDIYEGQITALIGHTGAGKTTLLNILSGMCAATSGSSSIYNYNHLDRDNIEDMRRIVGFCPESDVKFDPLTVKENLKVFAQIKGIPSCRVEHEIKKVTSCLQLTDIQNREAETLSAGQRRMLTLGIALLGDPKVLLLDEPTVGLDPFSRHQVWAYLKEMKADRVTLMSSQFMDEADILADRLAVISGGHLRCLGSSHFLKRKWGIGYNLRAFIAPIFYVGSHADPIESLADCCFGLMDTEMAGLVMICIEHYLGITSCDGILCGKSLVEGRHLNIFPIVIFWWLFTFWQTGQQVSVDVCLPTSVFDLEGDGLFTDDVIWVKMVEHSHCGELVEINGGVTKINKTYGNLAICDCHDAPCRFDKRLAINFSGVKMHVTSSCDPEAARSLIQQHISSAKLSTQNDQELTFTLPFHSMDAFPEPLEPCFFGLPCANSHLFLDSVCTCFPDLDLDFDQTLPAHDTLALPFWINLCLLQVPTIGLDYSDHDSASVCLLLSGSKPDAYLLSLLNPQTRSGTSKAANLSPLQGALEKIGEVLRFCAAKMRFGSCAVDLLSHLEERVGREIISYGVSSTTLNDVFLKLEEEVEADRGGCREFTQDVTSREDSVDDSPVAEDPIELMTYSGQALLSDWALWKQQVLAVARMRLLKLKHNKTSFWAIFLMMLCFITPLLFFTTVMYNQSTMHRRELESNMYFMRAGERDSRYHSRLLIFNNTGSPIEDFTEAVRSQDIVIEVTNGPYNPDTTRYKGAIEVSTVTKVTAFIFFFLCKKDDNSLGYQYTIIGNLGAINSLPVLLNIISNSVLKMFKSNEHIRIWRDSVHPNNEEEDKLDLLFESVYYMLFATAMTPLFAMSSIEDTRMKARAQLHISGLFPSAYWCGLALVDIPFYWLLLFLMIAIAFLFCHPLVLSFWLSCLLIVEILGYGAAAVLYVYVIAFIFRNGKSHHSLWTFFFILLFIHMDVMYYEDPAMVALSMLWCYIHIVLFSGILWCLEWKYGRRSLKKDPVFRTSKQSTKVMPNPSDLEDADEDVLAERERVKGAKTSKHQDEIYFKYTIVHLLCSKDEVSKNLSVVFNKPGRMSKVLCADNGTEYTNGKVQTILKKKAIVFQTIPNNPEQNVSLGYHRVPTVVLVPLVDNLWFRPVVIVSSLRKEFDTSSRNFRCQQKKIIGTKNISFCVRKGEILGVLGPNGAGKTTTLSMIAGELIPTAGEVQLCETVSSIHSSETIGYCCQESPLWPDMTIWEHLEIYAAIKGMKEEDVNVAVRRLAEALDLKDHLNKPAKKLSNGISRKVCLAISMLGNPTIVLLDEPSTGLDPKARQKLWKPIRMIIKNKQRGAILTTHYMEEAEAVCDRVAIMVSGKLRCIGSTQHLKSRFGKGYQLEIKVKDPQRADLIHQDIIRMFPLAARQDRFSSLLVYKIPMDDIQSLPRAFSLLEEAKRVHNFEEYSFSQPTLQQVFLELMKEQEMDDFD